MPIVFAAITPHPPLLIPEIGKENIEKAKATQEAMKSLEQSFYVSKPESVVIITPHGKIMEDSFNINLSVDYKADFKDFGDHSLEIQFKSDYMSIQEIRAADETQKDVPIVLSSEEKVDHGISVPLYCLTRHFKNIPIIPITYSALDYQHHYDFGKFLYRQLSKINKRFAIIASADLSHKVTKNAPGGYSPLGKKFDKQLVDLIEKQDTNSILKIDPKFAKAAGVCGLKSIITVLGIIDSLHIKPEILSYEAPFGVGYMVCNYKFD